MTIVYTLIRFFYSKEKFYISYSFMQIFSLIFIMIYSELFSIDESFLNITIAFASLSAIFFSISFFEGRFIPTVESFKELLIYTLCIILVLVSAFYHYILFEYLPYAIVYAILSFSVIFNFKRSFKPTMIYVIGWSIICLTLFLLNTKAYHFKGDLFDIVLMAFTLEAMLFTISISYRYNNLQKEKKEYENMVFQQSKLAKTGEMIGNIAHQFRQPLNNLSYILINVKNRFNSNTLEEVYFEKKLNQANNQIDFLSKTINDFKEFYIPSKTKEEFIIKESIESALSVISPDLKRFNILCDISYQDEETILFGIKNELSQVVLSIISNSSDAIKNIDNPKITIEILQEENKRKIVFTDNGPGIKEKDLKKVLEPYFTTKKEGTGLGLFLSKQIIEESFQGEMELKNIKEGFQITLFL